MRHRGAFPRRAVREGRIDTIETTPKEGSAAARGGGGETSDAPDEAQATASFERAFAGGDDPAYLLSRPAAQTVPLLFNSPHSGNVYTDRFRDASALPLVRLRASEDVAVDRLFASVTRHGAPLLAARFPRAWLDVNREPYELDPKLLRENLPAHANTRSLRVAGGLGTVPRLVSEGMAIYRRAPSLAEVQWRIETVYRAYHDALRGLVVSTAARFGHAVLIDCHSMPSRATGPKVAGRMPDIIVGDRFGTSCHSVFSQAVVAAFRERGYLVTRNKPYAGGFITEHYGKPAQGLHAVQIEINRALYMDETGFVPNAGFAGLQADIECVCRHLCGLPTSGFGPHVPMAAE